ncbi:MAG: hypothetical protein RLZZ303_1548 [Candidatus Hydrogenedentota bacterium]|jgi:ribokinase
MSKIVVVGSANVDFVSAVPRIPAPGETILGGDLVTTFGGKGANQAVAAARLGGNVHFVGCLGDDAFGERYLAHLEQEGIETSRCVRSSRPTGCALIAVDPMGANAIVCAPGANQDLLPRHVDFLEGFLAPGDVLLLQFEVPMETNLRAARLARNAGACVLLNPSPFLPCEDLLESGIDLLVVNEHEARHLDIEREGAVERLAAEGIIVTRGGESALMLLPGHASEHPAFALEPIDTVGAGDTFTGALAVASTERGLMEAIRFAHAAAALSTLSLGAQAAMPTRDQVERLLSSA